MSAGTVHSTRLGAHTALLEIDNPPTNALGREMRRALLARLDALEADLSIRAVVLTGRGRAFSSGDDLREREAALQRDQGDREPSYTFAHLLGRLEAFRAPTIAAVNGWAGGGGLEIALCCDIRVASADAQFVCAAVNIGLIASAYRLPRLIGVSRAKEMLLTGAAQDAAAAERFGLVTSIHPPGELVSAACTLAERIATRAPLSVEATKRVASRAPDLTPAEASVLIANEFSRLVASDDHAAALAAFREKREPKFTRS